ncbi:hypothetical protein H696_03453 [Fonticula alba]|uniref:FAM86 N-terminal domain-containing protein n=1 Tax=Fonticula alba TaxID=691883 RepID=A0A058Z7X5_FONAL|nr:hypothetical protein H696_03453 [Fonticula alba]KCV69988.1 hypothetical protein H696_03453 [Fonticula alba]|eukprot:XP_009495594.1 hypothetical protein H696_03453 [Fonticula alba]
MTTTPDAPDPCVAEDCMVFEALSAFLQGQANAPARLLAALADPAAPMASDGTACSRLAARVSGEVLCSELARLRPPPAAAAGRFIRQVVTAIESTRAHEVPEDMYALYFEHTMSPAAGAAGSRGDSMADDPLHSGTFRTLLVPPGAATPGACPDWLAATSLPRHLSVPATNRLISHGTTGLALWTASIALAELLLGVGRPAGGPAAAFPLDIGVPPVDAALGPDVTAEQLAALFAKPHFLSEHSRAMSVPEPGAWDTAALVCPDRQALGHAGPAWVAGRRVLELGSGLGFLGLAAALAGAEHVRMTDAHGRVLSALDYSVEINAKQLRPGALSTGVLDWADFLAGIAPATTPGALPSILSHPATGESAAATEGQHFDLILAADVIFEESLVVYLVAALRQLLAGRRNFPLGALVANTMRRPETVAFFVAYARAAGLQVREILPASGDGPGASTPGGPCCEAMCRWSRPEASRVIIMHVTAPIEV